MEKHFMLDIESTGIDSIKEDLLQIGILEATFDGNKWVPGRTLEIIQHTDKKPESAFAREHMAKLYEVCNRAPKWEAENIRWMILDFFAKCGATPPEVYLMGWNASNFDVPFLVDKGCLVPSRYETQADGSDKMVGDFHYRIYELGGAISLIQNKFPKRARKDLLEEAESRDQSFALPEGKQHDALYDCYSQLKTLNGLIAMAKD